jgi:hypothetical protein
MVAALPLRVLVVTVTVPPAVLRMAPPLVAEFPLRVLLLIVTVPPVFRIAPPVVAELLLSAELKRYSAPELEMAPPLNPRPFAMVRSSNTAVVPPVTMNGWTAPPPSTVVWGAPFPMISTSLVTPMVPAPIVMAVPSVLDEKVIWSLPVGSPAVHPPTGRLRLADWIASRSEQAAGLVPFSSAAVVTWITAAQAGAASRL